VVTTGAYRFAGTTEPGASVVAAGRYPAEVGADGSWEIVLMLNPGSNVATLVAEDAAGNATEVRVVVYLHACAETPQVAMAAGATAAAAMSGDLDGDGVADTVTSYLADSQWRLHVELAYGWETEVDITPFVIQPPPSPRRIVDVGLPVVVLERNVGVGVGAAYGFVAFSGCELRPVLGEEGSMPDIWIGGGPFHGDFFRCERARVTQVVISRSEHSINVTETRYPFSVAAARFGAPTIVEEEIPAPPTDGSADTAFEEELARRQRSACLS
jgi:hypothetical protein